MSKKAQKILSGVLMICLVVAMSACQGTNNSPTAAPPASAAAPAGNSNMNAPGTMPIVKTPMTFKIMVKGNSHVNTNELISMKEMEKRSNVKIEFTDILGTEVTDKLSLTFASGDLPDAIMRCSIPSETLTQQYENKNIVAVNPYLDYMPNFKNLMETNIQVKGLCPSPDGTVLSMPQLSEVVGSLMVNKFFINQTWLDKLGLKQPKTIDEVYNMLVAFRDKDPNGNGKQDEIPWTTSSIVHTYNAFRYAYGLGNGGSWERFDHNPSDWNKLRFIYTAPEFKEVLAFVNKLYTEKLMGQSVFDTANHGSIWKANASSNMVGLINEINIQFAGDYSKDFVGLDEAFSGPNGQNKFWGGYRIGLQGQGAFVVTTKCAAPEVLFSWVDYFYGEEGSLLYFLGIEGETCEKTETGRQFVDEYRIPAEGKSFDQSVGRVTLYPGGSNPSFAFNSTYGGGESLPEVYEASMKMMPFVPKDEDLIPTTYNLSADDNKIIKQYNADIQPIIDTAIADFITGKRPISDFDKYVSEINALNPNDYINVIQKAYDTYLANTK